LASSFSAPEPFGIYAKRCRQQHALSHRNASTVGREAKFIGRIGAELDVKTDTCRLPERSTHSLSRGSIWIARQSYADRSARCVSATSGDVREQPKIADGASELLQDVFGKDKNPSDWCMASRACRSACGRAGVILGIR